MKKIKTALLLLLLAVFVTEAGSLVYILVKGKTREVAKGDVIIVLGAAVYNKKPSPVYLERIRHAVDLYEDGKADKILFTGGTPKADYPTEADVGAQWARSHGIPQKDMLVETQSKNTFENLEYSKSILSDKKLSKAILVSDPYHMARVGIIASSLGYDYQLSPTPTSRFNNSNLRIKYRFLFQETVILIPVLVRSWFRA